MVSTIQIQYQNATFTADSATITIGNGGSFQLTNNNSLSISGSFTFDALSISSSSIGFYNSSTGVAVNGAISIPALSGGSGDPTIIANNFQGSATVCWPSSNGPQYQQLSPGNPIVLAGFIG